MTEERELDRTKFDESFEVQALRIPCKRTGEFMKRLRNHLLNMPRRKNVEASAAAGYNMLLLSREFKSSDGLPVSERDWLKEQLDHSDIQLTTHIVHRGYEELSTEEVLRQILPAGIEIPGSFEQAGQVCHLNLRDSQLPYRYLIGKVILDKNKSVKTVVNKTGKIETEFRTFPMEHLAGDSSTVVRLKEHQCWFEFEYRDVYWNSRLQEEHGRLIEALFIHPVLASEHWGPVLADCTCGIGPFSLPIVKQAHGVISHANDLNPESIRWLTRNAELNKLPNVDNVAEIPSFSDSFVAPQSGSKLVIHKPGDARDFVRGLFNFSHPVTHALFNLPATGVELLDCFRGLDYERQNLPSPLVCCYTFSDATLDAQDDSGCVADLLKRLALALDIPTGCLIYVSAEGRGRLPLPSPQVADMLRLADNKLDSGTPVAIRLIRNVAPSRHMFCVCFRVPKPVTDAAEPAEKKARMDDQIKEIRT